MIRAKVDDYPEDNSYHIEYTHDGAAMIGRAMVIDNSQIPWLYNVHINIENRGNGYGKEMISDVIQWCKKKGMKALGLDVSKENKVAIHMYTKAGFVTYLDNGWSIKMILNLGRRDVIH